MLTSEQFSNTYWDFAPDYSYVDIAASYGYASFFYDRLGVGLSSKPDPIQTIQGPLEVEIAQVLATSLRHGQFSDNKFPKIVGVGHSFGSIITNAITKQYPDSLDAAILTGFGTDLSGQPLFLQALNLAIANQNQPLRFAKLNNAFLVSSTIISNQIGFFKAPGFAPAILDQAEATKGTVTYGELNSLGGVGGLASNFTKPVAVVDGVNDLPFCSGNCSYPTDQAKAVQPKYYPNVADADFGSYLAPLTGHGVSFHYSAKGAYEYVQKFLVERGLGLQ
jgi:pimeloyl-ACP methyl ester carboxylesterase